MIYNPARDNTCHSKNTIILLLYHPIGCLAYNPIGNTLRLILLAQASRAPSRQADIFHNRKCRHAPLSSCTSPSILPGGEADGHKALATLRIACRACSCIWDSPCSRSLYDPDTSSSGWHVSIPANITLSVPFIFELL